METPQQITPNTKEFEVTGISRSGRVRKKSSKLLDFQSPDEVEKRVFKRTTASGNSRHPSGKSLGRGRPSTAALKARLQGLNTMGHTDDTALDDKEVENDSDNVDINLEANNTDENEVNDDNDANDDDMVNFDDVLTNNANLTANSDSDDGFGELVADFVGSEGRNADKNVENPDTKVRKSLYMTEKRSGKDGGRLERKDKGKSRFTAYSLWAKEYRKSSNFSKEVDFSTARRELWGNVSNKEKNTWRRKAKIQATKAKALEKDGKKLEKSVNVNSSNLNSTFINRPTTSRTKKLAEDKQKAKDDIATAGPSTSTAHKRPRTTSYNRRSIASTSHRSSATKGDSNSEYAATNGSSISLNNSQANTSASYINMPLPTIEAIDAAAHLKLLGESLTIIGDRLKEHEGQIAVSGSLSVLLDSLICSMGPLLCLTTSLPGLDNKPQLKANLATTLDNIAYIMPGL